MEIKIERKLIVVGGSVGITLPAPILDALGLKVGDKFSFTVEVDPKKVETLMNLLMR